jgi:hypothetical protein
MAWRSLPVAFVKKGGRLTIQKSAEALNGMGISGWEETAGWKEGNENAETWQVMAEKGELRAGKLSSASLPALYRLCFPGAGRKRSGFNEESRKAGKEAIVIPPQEQQFVPSPIAPHKAQVGRCFLRSKALVASFPPNLA